MSRRPDRADLELALKSADFGIDLVYVMTRNDTHPSRLPGPWLA